METKEDIYQAIYKHQKLVGSNGEEYVVRGASVFCGWGSKPCVLNLPVDHGETTADGRPLITYSDCGTENIKGFGYCKKYQRECSPKLDEWTHSKRNKKIYNSNTHRYEYAVTRESTAICNGDTFVAFNSSGQTIPDYLDTKSDAIDIIEDEKKEWVRGKNGKDLFGHIKVNYSGIYSFGIYTSKRENYTGGSVFFYQKSAIGKVFKYVEAYKLSEHINEKREKFKDLEDLIFIPTNEYPTPPEEKEFYWTIWTDFLLYEGMDYYVEIDCPNIDRYKYKLICLEYIEIDRFIETINQLINDVDHYMENIETKFPELLEAVTSAKFDRVVAIGISGSMGQQGYISTSAQLVIDANGDIGIQIAAGSGIIAGSSAKGSLYFAFFPFMKDIYEMEGLGEEMGGSIGKVTVISLSALFAGEGDDVKPVGGLFGVGIGGGATPVEGHTAMSYTFSTIKLGNIYNGSWKVIYESWKAVYKQWNDFYSSWKRKEA